MRKIYLTSLILFLGFGIVKAQETENTQEGLDIVTVSEVEEIVVEPTFQIKWEESYDEALRRAKEEKKPLLIYFTGSDWCGPCKVLGKKLFNTEKFQEYSDTKLILYKANFPRNKNLVDEATQKINAKISSRYGQRKFPTMIIVDNNENVINSKRGMYMTEYYYPFFDKAIKNF